MGGDYVSWERHDSAIQRLRTLSLDLSMASSSLDTAGSSDSGRAACVDRRNHYQTALNGQRRTRYQPNRQSQEAQMAVEDEFPIPPGEAARVIGAGRTLDSIAAAVSGAAEKVDAELNGMAAAWSGEAGIAAFTETGHAGKITEAYGRRLGAGGAALRSYGDALANAISVAQDARKSARAEFDSVLDDVTRQRYVEPARSYAIQSLMAPTMQRLGAQYHDATDRLRRAADSAASALTDLVPFYLPGMNPELLTELARSGTAYELPLLQRKDGERIANELADKVKPYLDERKQVPDDLLAEIARNRLNPWFAKTFLKKLGPRMPLALTSVSQAQGFPADYNQRVITLFGELLALGTWSSGEDRLFDQYVDELLTPLDQHNDDGVDAALALSQFLAVGGTFGRDFLRKFGDKLDALKNASPGTSIWTSDSDVEREGWADPLLIPLEAYFRALSLNPDAAQDFFVHHDRLQYYVRDRNLDSFVGDHGKSLGEALVAATTVYRNADQTGLRSAQISADLLNTLGELSHFWEDEHSRQQLRPAVVTILNNYADDIYYSLSRRDMGVSFAQDASLPPGVRLGNKQLGTGLYGINLAAPAIRQVLGQVDHDVAAYATVLQAQLDAAARFLDADLAYIRSHPGDRDKVLQEFGSGYGRVLDTLFNTHIQVQLALDDKQNQEVDFRQFVIWTSVVVFFNVLNSYLPFKLVRMGAPLVVTGSLGAFLGITLPWAVAYALRPSVTDKREVAALEQLDRWWMDNQFRLVDQMQKGGAFAGTHADANTWMAEHHITGDTKFTDADGKLLPITKIAEDPHRWDAYLRWHVDEDGKGLRMETSDLADAIQSQVILDPPKIG